MNNKLAAQTPVHHYESTINNKYPVTEAKLATIMLSTG